MNIVCRYDTRFESLDKSSGDVRIIGLFQSWKYFQDVRPCIMKEFTFLPQYQSTAENFLRQTAVDYGYKSYPFIRPSIHPSFIHSFVRSFIPFIPSIYPSIRPPIHPFMVEVISSDVKRGQNVEAEAEARSRSRSRQEPRGRGEAEAMSSRSGVKVEAGHM